jgi:hypothetical protein
LLELFARDANWNNALTYKKREERREKREERREKREERREKREERREKQLFSVEFILSGGGGILTSFVMFGLLCTLQRSSSNSSTKHLHKTLSRF